MFQVNPQWCASAKVFDLRAGPLKRDGDKTNLVLDR